VRVVFLEDFLKNEYIKWTWPSQQLSFYYFVIFHIWYLQNLRKSTVFILGGNPLFSKQWIARKNVGIFRGQTEVFVGNVELWGKMNFSPKILGNFLFENRGVIRLFFIKIFRFSPQNKFFVNFFWWKFGEIWPTMEKNLLSFFPKKLHFPLKIKKICFRCVEYLKYIS